MAQAAVNQIEAKTPRRCGSPFLSLAFDSFPISFALLLRTPVCVSVFMFSGSLFLSFLHFVCFYLLYWRLDMVSSFVFSFFLSSFFFLSQPIYYSKSAASVMQ